MATRPVRRSSRARSKHVGAYDEELQVLAKKQLATQESGSEASDKVEEMKNAMLEVDDEDLDDKNDQEDFNPKKKAKKSPSPQKSSKKQKRPIQVKIGKTTTTRKTTNTRGTNRGRQGVHNALKKLSKEVLDPSETPETSLVAALLASSKPIAAIPSSTPRTIARPATLYTPQLEGIARHLLQEHEPNSLHIQLLNLLFRSIGGSVESNLAPDTDLEELDDNEWDTLVTNVVEVMKESDTELLTANPDERVGPKEYRAIYQEFWYRLGVVMLSHSPQGGGDSDDFSSNRFQVEMVRELVSRVTELVMVGQPDLRSGATIAIWQLAVACMERTVELETKLATAQRQSNAAKGQSRKLQALQHNMDSWRRHKAELEEIVEGTVLQGVFIHRYRDSNPHIRVCSLETLSGLTVLRPDLFLRDKYLKYFGWMASDKVAFVRLAALQGLLAPFKAVRNNRQSSKLPSTLQIDLTSLQNVCSKFLTRMVDCTEDSQSLQVQETAVELLRAMLQEEFLDEWDDDNGWDQVNLKALDSNTTPRVRKDALYFILDQLDCFDTEDDNKSYVSSQTVSDKKQVERIEGIASWIANKLCDGPISIDKIKAYLADHVIESLRDMPEHKHLAVNWTAMLKAIRSENPQQGRPAGREELAKQRVLLRMLASAAKMEVGSLDDYDKSNKRRRESSNSSQSQEGLSVALLKSLPHLLTAFKGDIIALRSLTKLPQYLIPAVFSLPARKSDFQSLVKNLCKLFLEITDEEVLQNISAAMSILVQGDHARVAEVKMQLKRVSASLQDRLMELFEESDPQNESPKKTPAKKNTRSKRASPRKSSASNSSMSSDGMLSTSPEVDVEHSIYLCLLRLRILIKRCPLDYLFEETDDEDEEIEAFCSTISEAIGKRLHDRKPILEADFADENDSTKAALAKIWKNADAAIHAEVAKTVDEALQVLLTVISWLLLETLNDRKKSSEGNLEEDIANVEDLLVLRMRDRLTNLLGLCFDQYLDENLDLMYSDEEVDFAYSVQASAGRVASDTRTLFPREWSKAVDPVRQTLALTNDAQLIGGFARFLQSKDAEFAEIAANEDDGDGGTLVRDLLLPLTRGLTANWTDGNRKEAGIVLAHITGSGQGAANAVHATARMLKKINPVRFLEAQMACLRMSFENWVNNEPEELDVDRPSEDQLHEYEESEKLHSNLFHTMEVQASRLSMSLGVGRLTDGTLSRALLSFMQEGVRFAFEGNRAEEDELVLGSRLPFLLVLTKYATWIKKNKQQLEMLTDFVLEKEAALRTHPEFDEVHDDDLSSLKTFKEALGIAEIRRRSTHMSSTQDDHTVDDHMSAIATPSPAASSANPRRRISTASSQRSRLSPQSNLSPLYEEDGAPDSEEKDDSPSPQKRRRLSTAIDEEEEAPGSDAESNAS